MFHRAANLVHQDAVSSESWNSSVCCFCVQCFFVHQSQDAVCLFSELCSVVQRFYLVGRDKSKQHWRVLKIDRSEPTELCLCEDPVVYTKREHFALLNTIDEGNKATGGLLQVTKAYGIVGRVNGVLPSVNNLATSCFSDVLYHLAFDFCIYEYLGGFFV